MLSYSSVLLQIVNCKYTYGEEEVDNGKEACPKQER